MKLPSIELPNFDDFINSTATYTDYKPADYDEYDYYNDYTEDYTEDYKLEDFYDYPEISEFEEEYVFESVTWNLNFQALSIIINLLHLTVLTRKQLRSNAVYIYMMMICFSDILNFAVGIYDPTIQYVESETPRRLVKEEVEYFCVKAKWFVLNVEVRERC
ncbi:hypothetical protein CAEBREN_29749 [Caenorhabditis brenneri]|uniref:G-protein coupled receptors family 1 profile domain-containing protein n=1 Tax=Caenorhabditis brenneri TaxID=135651 RepID=G0P3D8_CAEBE|nr:hypothetical protein CAEBREN_29749 [Caenorhabditis brenneri]